MEPHTNLGDHIKELGLGESLLLTKESRVRGCRHSQFALSRTAPTPRTLGLSRGNDTAAPAVQLQNPD